MNLQEFELKEKLFIPLCDLLKVTNLCENGGQAKHVIADGLVQVDGMVELRKRAKIIKGQLVEYQGTQIKLI
jgi:ribosome-associated protein